MLKLSSALLIASTLCVPATLALALDVPGPKAATASVHAGQDVFNSNCMQCHAIQPDQVRFGPSLYGELKKPHPKKTDTEVRQILKGGKGKMPSFDSKLKPEDISNLLAYLHTL
jgi:mono/diheme cytochrome c family protein